MARASVEGTAKARFEMEDAVAAGYPTPQGAMEARRIKQQTPRILGWSRTGTHDMDERFKPCWPQTKEREKQRLEGRPAMYSLLVQAVFAQLFTWSADTRTFQRMPVCVDAAWNQRRARAGSARLCPALLAGRGERAAETALATRAGVAVEAGGARRTA